MSEKFAASKVSGAHHQLSKLEGHWKGTAKTWFEADVVGDESPVEGTMKLILDGRFIMHEYSGSMAGQDLQGIVIIGYHLALQKYQTAWIDSFHNGTAIMFSESNKASADINVLGSYAYVTPELEQHWGWRTEINLLNDDELIFTAFNISPEGEEVKATETHYKRVMS